MSLGYFMKFILKLNNDIVYLITLFSPRNTPREMIPVLYLGTIQVIRAGVAVTTGGGEESEPSQIPPAWVDAIAAH